MSSSLIWNAENRLVAVTTPDNVTSYYTYDYLGRRIGKQAATAPATHTLYDGWNPIAEYTGGALNKSYTWGMDLSGSKRCIKKVHKGTDLFLVLNNRPWNFSSNYHNPYPGKWNRE